MSLKISQLTGALVLASPYREVEASLSKLSGISWSYEAIRKNAIQEGSWIGKREKEEQKQVKNLNYDMPEEKPETVYNKAGATYLCKQNKGGKGGCKKRHLEVKIGISYKGKELKYNKGKRHTKKLSRKVIYTNIKTERHEFLDRFSCLSERIFGTFLAKKSYLSGDGDSWIREGKKEHFSNSEYLLCPFHLFLKLL